MAVTMEMQALIERIYETAFIPEVWNDVLEQACKLSNSASGQFLVFAGGEMTAWRSTACGRTDLENFFAVKGWVGSAWNPDRRLPELPGGEYFYLQDDLMTPGELAADLSWRMRDRSGRGWHTATPISLPTGETIVFTFDRPKQQGRHDIASMARLNALRPHLARAGLLASRLGLEHARGALAALTALDLPAALLDARGRLREANARLLSATPALFDTRADNHVALGNPAADAMLAAVLCGASNIRSIPLPPHGRRPAYVAHVIALAGAARDPFSSASSLLVLHVAGRHRTGPDASTLRVLFDLSASESRLAGSLASGIDLRGAAAQCGIRVSTARAYLERIFQKTGCHRQGELVALLGGLTAPRNGDSARST